MISIQHGVSPAVHRVYLVADIGGTNARFAVAHASHSGVDGGSRLSHAAGYLVRDFPTLADSITHYLQSIPTTMRPNAAVLAVASAATGDQILFANSPWSFSVAALKIALGLRDVHIVNDLAAVAWALSDLHADDVQAVGNTRLVDPGGAGTRAIVGTGTGLGVSAVKSTAEGVTVIQSEGGHASFAPNCDEHVLIYKYLKSKYARVSYERVLCGAGLLNLYEARCAISGSPSQCTTPEQVSLGATAGDVAAQSATADFCSILGAFAGDAVLMFGAWSGVYLTGGVLAHVLGATGAVTCRASFEDKGRLSPLLQNTPMLLIKQTEVGTMGAAALGARIF